MARSLAWTDYFQGREGVEVEARETPLIHVKKTNFPPKDGENKYIFPGE